MGFWFGHTRTTHISTTQKEILFLSISNISTQRYLGPCLCRRQAPKHLLYFHFQITSPHHTAHTRPNQNPKSHSLIIGSTHLVIRSEALCCSCFMFKHFLPFCYHLLFAVSNHITASTPTHPSPSFTLTTKTKIYFRLNKLFNLNTCIKFSTFNSFS